MAKYIVTSALPYIQDIIHLGNLIGSILPADDALDKNGYIVETSSLQPYCNIDKRFIPDRFIEGTCPYC